MSIHFFLLHLQIHYDSNKKRVGFCFVLFVKFLWKNKSFEYQELLKKIKEMPFLLDIKT